MTPGAFFSLLCMPLPNFTSKGIPRDMIGLKNIGLAALCLAAMESGGQSLPGRLDSAIRRMESDSQLVHGILSFCVMDAGSGQLMYDHHSEIGLAPASCQKIFTSIAALDMLGPGFTFVTRLEQNGSLSSGILRGDLVLRGGGDPTFGSWRWPQTAEDAIWKEILEALKRGSVRRITGNLLVDISGYSLQPIPEGWIWADIGNYYGAGTWALNWRENQYDMILQPGRKVGAQASLRGTKPASPLKSWTNLLLTGEKGSGDNAYIYLPPYGNFGFLEGTVPLGEDRFVISGALPDPPLYFGKLLVKTLKNNRIRLDGSLRVLRGDRNEPLPPSLAPKVLWTHDSPPLDSINYWFLKKSINLYGEALVKAIAFRQSGRGDTERGIEALVDFWASRGIEGSAIHLLDGSGLSPQNRVTARALVKALQYARGRPWFGSFYHALPEIHGIHMKSGSIGGVRTYAGYQETASGGRYIFALMINNFDGPDRPLLDKMWHLLDLLK
jgi:D-alanyl-D-alanine carboxypeptidase/D-alanyl-D-alanine-endopeptidase (penicillin-binding protein 4)